MDVPKFAAKFEPSERDCSGLNPLIAAAEKRHTPHDKQVSKIGLRSSAATFAQIIGGENGQLHSARRKGREMPFSHCS